MLGLGLFSVGRPLARSLAVDKRLVLGGLAVAAVGGYLYLRHSQSVTNSQAGTTVVDPNAPTSIAQQTVPVQGVTDSSGNLLPQFSWPYNQLALPYNYSQSTGNLGSYTNAQNPNFVGYNQTVVNSG